MPAGNCHPGPASHERLGYGTTYPTAATCNKCDCISQVHLSFQERNSIMIFVEIPTPDTVDSAKHKDAGANRTSQ